MKRKIKKIFAFLLAVIICISITNVNVLAEENSWNRETLQKVYVGDNYNITYTLTGQWNGGYTANINITNIGSKIIENWHLKYDSNNIISNIWNAEMYSYDNENYIVKNVGWNRDIAVGESIEFGFVAKENFLGFPKNCELLDEIVESRVEDYTIEYHLDRDWGSGFIGTISITNNTDAIIEDWVLEFDFERNITGIWNGIIEYHEGIHYKIVNADYNADIAPGKTVSFGFSGDSGDSAQNPANYSLNNYIFIIEESDSDNDNLSNDIEKDIGTDINNADSDFDGLSDYQEVFLQGLIP